MSLSADTLRRLAALKLSPTAMAEVLSIIADIAEKTELALQVDRERARRRRELLPSNWVDVCAEVFERDSYVCQYCSIVAVSPHCDHVVPLSRGGASTLENLVTACPTCNMKKGARTPQEWRQ